MTKPRDVWDWLPIIGVWLQVVGLLGLVCLGIYWMVQYK